jgi:hypothetical protein
MSHEKRNRIFPAGFTVVMETEGRNSDTISTFPLRSVLTRRHFRNNL